MFNLLLIEDDVKCARMVEKIMEPHEFKVHHAATALDGLQLARKTSFDIILLDMDLPDLDGKVVAIQLRSVISRGTTPIIAFTAENGARAKRIALAVGCDDFISKPIDTRAFPAQISAIIQSSKT
jgi:DNA-binding response OmpR family regulator